MFLMILAQMKQQNVQRWWKKEVIEWAVRVFNQKAYFITVWLMFQFPDLVLIKRK